MNYDHCYHAGSFTDVFKHVVLMCLLEKLKDKESAFCYLDSHSAYPYYQLDSTKALKTKEAQQGIKKIWQAKQVSPVMQNYLQLIDAFNKKLGADRLYYPGSGTFAAMLKRAQDRVILNELESTPFQALKSFFRNDKQVHCHQQDAYQILKALLPPKEKRGLVLIDPPYENPNEFQALVTALKMALERWPQGVYAIWYPIKEKHKVELFAQKLARLTERPQVNFTCCPWPNDVSQRLSGSGMLIINPPWQIEKTINPVIAELCKLFNS